jgi:hypothetical protein
MKGGLRKNKYNIMLAGLYISLAAIGWYIGGLYLSLAGLILAYLVDSFLPKWKYDLTWKEIDMALHNLYKYGNSPSELCFRVGEKRVFVYRDEKGKKEPIRMAVCLPLADWSDLYDKEDYRKLLDTFGGLGMYSNNRGPESYDLFTKAGQRPKDCREILKTLFVKSVGGLRPNIYAQSVVSSKKDIWKKYENDTGES